MITVTVRSNEGSKAVDLSSSNPTIGEAMREAGFGDESRYGAILRGQTVPFSTPANDGDLIAVKSKTTSGARR